MIDDLVFYWNLARGIQSVVVFCKDVAQQLLAWSPIIGGIGLLWLLCSGSKSKE